LKKQLNYLERKTAVSETEQKILLAAREEFSERGFDGARMQAIADHAGTNKALLHYYFRSKEKLFKVTLKDIIATLWSEIHARLDAHQKETDLRSLISTIVSAYITTFAAQPALPKMVIREVTLGSPVLFEVVNEFITSFDNKPNPIFTIYNNELRRGAIKHIELLHFMMNLMSMCAVTFIFIPLAENINKKTGIPITFDQKFFDKRIEAITEMACDGIFIHKNVKQKEG
jgi:TetR/AcrR family transcriptional regulator